MDNLPCAEHYYKSFMHRDAVNYVTVSKYASSFCHGPGLSRLLRTEFLITCSEDGHLKLWKKQAEGIEFVKHYRAHLGPVRAISCSEDGSIFATIGTDPRDRGAKIFDIVNFGLQVQLARSKRKLSARRYDQSDQIRLRTKSLLLDFSQGTSEGFACCVSKFLNILHRQELSNTDLMQTLRKYTYLMQEVQ